MKRPRDRTPTDVHHQRTRAGQRHASTNSRRHGIMLHTAWGRLYHPHEDAEQNWPCAFRHQLGARQGSQGGSTKKVCHDGWSLLQLQNSNTNTSQEGAKLPRTPFRCARCRCFGALAPAQLGRHGAPHVLQRALAWPHCSMQPLWKTSPHGRVLTESPAASLSKQMAHWLASLADALLLLSSVVGKLSRHAMRSFKPPVGICTTSLSATSTAC
mmetsp:Transcript_53603/g.142864  ORF Transcript_53603/g.142864 Transcript_53603/m.142864 type:complete len:213 (+) Transcript_53603:111-749(+)